MDCAVCLEIQWLQVRIFAGRSLKTKAVYTGGVLACECNGWCIPVGSVQCGGVFTGDENFSV